MHLIIQNLEDKIYVV